MNIEVLYEDDNIVAINKPAGLVVHSDGKTKEPTLTDWILEKYPDTKDVGEPIVTSNGQTIYRPGIVHRLDRETSGVMLIAKTQEGFEVLKKQFQNHDITKEYKAFVFGEMKNDTGIIDRPIGRSSQDFRRWSAQRGARGQMREAITEYKVIDRKDGYSFVSAFPKTGRTHQIRVHFKAINHPLIADGLYTPNRENALGFVRLALHSYSVTFTDLEGEKHQVFAKYPEDFEKAISILHK